MLETTRRVDTVVLDKTGTVTTGQMTLLDTIVADGEDEQELLRLAGALENASEHPIAQAIAKGATARVGALPAVEDFANVEGLGVQGVVWTVTTAAPCSSAGRACLPTGRSTCRRSWRPR